MKIPVQLWVRLKVIDLVAQTARITLADKLNFSDTLRGITRYWYWGMEADGADEKSILEEIERAIRLDGAFTNQNKHLYRLATGRGPVRGDLVLEKDLSAPGGAAGGGSLYAFDCLVREKRPDREIGFAERLNSRLKGVSVSNMKHGEVWRLIVSASSEKAALADVERMLVSRSRREGLLLNPHYQQYEIIAATRVEAGKPAAGARSKE
jgi:phosphoribosylformylglycinamidine (FGAM) synthase PurS component